MAQSKLYALPELPYGYGDLQPHMSEEQLRIHHTKHHQAYVNGANAALQRLERARREGLEVDVKAVLKELSWNIGGHVLHTLFWYNMAPPGRGGGRPGGRLADAIDAEFGSFERFRREFSQAALTVEGSGWAALALCPLTGRLLILQIEKHNVNVAPTLPILMVLDVFEHAYYVDYRNDRGKFVEAFWSIVNWDEVEKRLGKVLG